MSKVNENRPGYKYTPLGWIPEEWEVDRLGKLVKLISGLHLNPNEYNKDGQGIPYFTGPTDYTNCDNDLTKWTLKKAAIARADDVLITVKGSGVGSMHYLLLPEVAIGRQIMAIRDNENTTAPFIYQYLLQKDYHFQELAKGNMIPGLTRDDILSLEMRIPTLEERHKIATILSTWDKAITKTQQLITQLQLRNSGLMSELLTGKRRLKGFRRKWNKLHIYEIAEEVSLKNKKAKDLTVLSCTKYDGLVPSLEYFGRRVFGDDTSTYKIVPLHHFAYATNHIEEGSIGYQESFEEALISPMYTVFKTNGHVLDSYFFKLLKSKNYIHEYCKRMEGSIDRRGGLRWNEFSKIVVFLPELEEQKAINEIFMAADNEMILLKQKLTALQNQKKGIMQRLLTGEVRVKM